MRLVIILGHYPVLLLKEVGRRTLLISNYGML